MCTTKYGQLAMALVSFGFGCSAKTSTPATDGSAGVHEAGKLTDTRTIDAQALDSKTLDSKATDSGIADGAASSMDSGHAADVRDTQSAIDSSHDVASSKDGSQDYPGSADTSQVKDVNGSPADVAVETGPIGFGTCASPIKIPQGFVHFDVTKDTTGAAHVFDFPCANNGASLVFQITIPSRQPQLVYADTFGTAWNTALFFSDDCDTPTTSSGMESACNDDACGTSQSQAVVAVGYGYHYLVVSGVNGESGPVTVHFQAATLGSGPTAYLPQGSGSEQGSTSGTDTSALCEAAGPMDNYWWPSCPDDVGGDFHASTCDGLKWDTVLGLQIPRTDTLACTNVYDPACEPRSSIDATLPPGAGVQVLTVGGSNAKDMGNYTLTYARP